MKGWVYLLLILDSAVIIRSESRGAHDHILLSQIWHSTNLEGQFPVYIYIPGIGWSGYTPRHSVPFRRLLRHVGRRWKYSTPPPHNLTAFKITSRCESHPDTVLLLLRACSKPQKLFTEPLLRNAAVLLLRACMFRTLPSNGSCLQSHRLAKGLYATIYNML
jgi:hypothetical protein